MDLERLVLRDGDLVGAAGRVVAVAGEVRFEPPLPRHLVYFPPGSEPAPVFSGVGVASHGVDLSALHDRFDKDGAVEGFATLHGRWDGGALQVTGQGPPRWPTEPIRPRLEPPGPAPAGGWPHGRVEENLDVPQELVGDPAVVGVLLVRPSATQVVLTVVSTDPEGTHARWSSVFPGRLCVVASRWTRELVETVRDQAQTLMPQWQAYQAGFGGFGDDCQPVITLKVVQVLPALVTWSAGVPEGLLEVGAWLTPRNLREEGTAVALP